MDNSQSNEVLSKEAAAKDERASTLNSQINDGIWKEKFNFGVRSVFYHKIDSHSFLVTGGDNYSVCLWQHDRAAEKVALLWSSSHTLCAINASLTSTLLSKDNCELLKQRGRNDGDEDDNDEDDNNDEATMMKKTIMTTMMKKTIMNTKKNNDEDEDDRRTGGELL